MVYKIIFILHLHHLTNLYKKTKKCEQVVYYQRKASPNAPRPIIKQQPALYAVRYTSYLQKKCTARVQAFIVYYSSLVKIGDFSFGIIS